MRSLTPDSAEVFKFQGVLHKQLGGMASPRTPGPAISMNDCASITGICTYRYVRKLCSTHLHTFGIEPRHNARSPHVHAQPASHVQRMIAPSLISLLETFLATKAVSNITSMRKAFTVLKNSRW